MALRDQERRLLAEIEQGLAEGDPLFVATCTELSSRVGKATRVIRFVVVLLAAYVVGLTAVVGGVVLSSAVLVVLGGALTACIPVAVGWRAWRTRWA